MKWINVSERLPAIGTSVLVTDGKIILVGERLPVGQKDDWRWEPSGVDGYEFDWELSGSAEKYFYNVEEIITHWMCLPPLPRIKTEKPNVQ